MTAPASSRWGAVPLRAVTDLSAAAPRVYAALACYARDGGWTYVSAGRIAADLGSPGEPFSGSSRPSRGVDDDQDWTGALRDAIADAGGWRR
jgi:hypothetical protein